MKKSNGITLIALIITIIIMLILVAVSISILINSGLIGKAKEGAKETKTAYEEEQKVGETINVDGVEYTIDEYLDSLNEEGGTTEGLQGLTSEEIALLETGVTEKPYADITNENLKDPDKIKAVLTDGSGEEVPIPVGASYVTGLITGTSEEAPGVVIEYKGSQFVWVPITADNNLYVKGTTKPMARPSTGDYAGTDANGLTNYEGVLYNFNGSGDNTTSSEMTNYGQNTTSNREPAYLTNSMYSDASSFNEVGITKDSIQEEYNNMIDSVKKYGGFYVGRYESSLDGKTIASIADVYPMTASTDAGNRWYGMYQREKEFSGSSQTDTMQSSMIWGSQYDAMLNWILTGTDKEKITAKTNGNHSGSRAKTGATTTDVMNNIYDLEGNIMEWTKEANTMNSRVLRGRPLQWGL